MPDAGDDRSPDHNVDPHRAATIADAIPNARLVEFADSAHMIELEEPHAYTAVLLDFPT